MAISRVGRNVPALLPKSLQKSSFGVAFVLAPMVCYRAIVDTADRQDLHVHPSSFVRQNKKTINSLTLGDGDGNRADSKGVKAKYWGDSSAIDRSFSTNQRPLKAQDTNRLLLEFIYASSTKIS
jgi:hypothetical protein